MKIMNNIYVIITAISLSIDATIVSITSGVKAKNVNIFKLIELPLFFGIFQAIMPLLGYRLGWELKGLFSGYENLVAAFLLFIAGGKIIYDAITPCNTEEETYLLTIYFVLLLSIATSIDAFSVGTSFAFIKYPIYPLSILSGLITFISSLCAIFIGRQIENFLKNKAEIFGGIVLIILGFKALLNIF